VWVRQRKKKSFSSTDCQLCHISCSESASAVCVLRCKVAAHLSAKRLCSNIKRVLKPEAIRIRHLNKVDRHYICAFYPPISVGYFVYIFCFPCALAFLTQSRSGRDALCHAAYMVIRVVVDAAGLSLALFVCVLKRKVVVYSVKLARASCSTFSLKI
jgi:hypothetical protein